MQEKDVVEMPHECILHGGSPVLLRLPLGEEPVSSMLPLNVTFSGQLMAAQGLEGGSLSRGRMQLKHKR